MSGAEIGAVVSLYYDSANEVEVGDYLRTHTGRTYRAVAVRIQSRGTHLGRQHLMAEVVDPAVVGPEEVVHLISWYPRGKSLSVTRRGHTMVILAMLAAGLAFGLLWPYYFIPG